MAKIKSNDRMPARSRKNVDEFMSTIEKWESKHKKQAMRWIEEINDENAFELLHALRRWYSGQTMIRLIDSYHDELSKAMDLSDDSAAGLFRGFKVYKDDDLAKSKVGDICKIPMKRNHGFSSWTLKESVAHNFSGASKERIGLVVRLINVDDVTSVLAPPSKSKPWFNALYEYAISSSFRPKEEEYVLKGSPIEVEIVKVKK